MTYFNKKGSRGTSRGLIIALRAIRQGNAIIMHDVNITIAPGEILSVVGRSNNEVDSIGNVFNPSSDIEIDGDIELAGYVYSDRQSLQSNIYYIGYIETILNNLSVYENIFLTDSACNLLSRRKLYLYIAEIFQRFSISIDPWASAASLNRNEKTLVELVRAYVHKSDLCIIGDLFSEMDKEYQEIAKKLVQCIKEEHQPAILFIPTGVEDALLLSEKLVVVRDQRIIREFQSSDVIKDPKRLMYCISGWSERDIRNSGNVSDMINLLLDMHNAIESTSELRRALTFLSDSILSVMNADSCAIALMDDEYQAYMTIGDERTIENVFSEHVFTQGKALNTTSGEIYLSDRRMVERINGLQHLFYVPILFDNDLEGLILVGFHERQRDSSNMMQILNNFAREMAIIIETSRLVGKSVLLQESHHRIKNNLQIIVNLLYMQKTNLVNAGYQVTESFDQMINQVKSIAIIHDLLSKDQLGKNIVNLKTIITEIVGFYERTGIHFDMELENISIPYNKAATISLLINELVANSVKHAFTIQTDRHIYIICKSMQGNLSIVIGDNGIGFPNDETKRKHGIGWNIIHTTVQKMGGSIREDNDNGARTEISLIRAGIYE